MIRKFLIAALSVGTLLGQVPTNASVSPQLITPATSSGRVATVRLAPRYATAIRMQEPISSVVVGDPSSFSVEHSEQEPQIVFVKPLTLKPAESNLLITTTRGYQATLLLTSRGKTDESASAAVDFVLSYRPAGRFLIEPADYPSAFVPQIAPVSRQEHAANTATMKNTSITAKAPLEDKAPVLDQLLKRQSQAPLPKLYGVKPDVSAPEGDLVRAGVSEVIDQGREVVLLFSVVNPQHHSIEIMPPQVQLGGKVRSGKVFRRSRWATAEQFPIVDFRLSRRRLGPGERADGVVVFERPPYKQSNETLFLQIAESGAVDRPALAPIGFGISTFAKENKERDDARPSGQQ